MKPLVSSTPEILGCSNCPAERACFRFDQGFAKCPACEVQWAVGPHGSINSLTNPAQSVLHEIDGMRSEHPELFPTRESFIFQQVDQLVTLDALIQREEGSPKNYYRSTYLNFLHAFEQLNLTGSERVLEVGAVNDFPFLQKFRDRGCECFATNLYLRYEKDREPIAQVVLGDMNALPYRNGVFDVVLLSATSHHSPDLPGLMAELSRVVRPGGYVLLLNDPTHGLLKHSLDRFGYGTRKGGDRHDLVNENEYSAAAYHRLAKSNGFNVVDSFFSVYYDEKLQSGKVGGVRFAPLAKLVSVVWRVAPLRAFLKTVGFYPAQMLLGLELNMTLKKNADLPAGKA